MKKNLSWFKPLRFDEALRATLCMVPMLVAIFMKMDAYIVPFGQGGFYFSSLPLSKIIGKRFTFGMVVLTIGLGFYLSGAGIIEHLYLSLFITFLAGLIIVLLTDWRVVGILAFSLATIYSAGLNSNPESAFGSYLAFMGVMIWSIIISMLPIWKGDDMPEMKKPTAGIIADTGFRLGFGMAFALLLSQLTHFSKLGWAPSGVANAVRYDGKTTNLRGVMRLVGTVLGAAVVIITFAFTVNPTILLTIAFLCAVINGLLKNTKWGLMPFFYTITILLLYSANSTDITNQLAIQRVVSNTIGVVIAVLIVWYPFPILSKKIREIADKNYPQE